MRATSSCVILVTLPVYQNGRRLYLLPFYVLLCRHYFLPFFAAFFVEGFLTSFSASLPFAIVVWTLAETAPVLRQLTFSGVYALDSAHIALELAEV